MNKFEHIKKLNELLKENGDKRPVHITVAPVPQKAKEKLKLKNK